MTLRERSCSCDAPIFDAEEEMHFCGNHWGRFLRRRCMECRQEREFRLIERFGPDVCGPDAYEREEMVEHRWRRETWSC